MGHCLFLRKGSVHTKPASLPAGYTKLAYIQSSGTQYIDTGIRGDSDIRTIMDFVFDAKGSGTVFAFGAQGTDNVRYTLALTSDGNFRSDYGTQLTTGSAAAIGTRYSIDKNRNVCKINGTPILSSEQTFNGTTNIYLFARSYSSLSYSKGKLFFCKIFKGDTLLRDYIPCINPSGAVGLYDLVGKQFYGNSGTGIFYAGPPVVTLPEGYTQLMYLESSGTQYINTGFTPNQDARIQLDCERTAANATDHFFGVRTGNSASSAFAFYIYNSGWRWAYNNATASGTGPDIGRYFIDANKNITTINGDTTLTGTYASFTAAAAAPLFAMLSAPSGFSYGSFRLYTCRIYNNGLMVRDFIPCRNASETIGIYDLVNGQFYTNAGTGAFTAGEVE